MNDANRTTRTETNRTMREVSHANPYTNKTVGQLFSRGPTAVTDGGERTGDGSRSTSDRRSDDGEPSETRRTPEDESSGSERTGDGSRVSPEQRSGGGEPSETRRTSAEGDGDPENEPETESQRMRDVEHTPPHDADDANRVFERGREPTPADRQPTVSEE